MTRMSASERASQGSRDANSEMERLRDLRIEDEHADQPPTRPADADQVGQYSVVVQIALLGSLLLPLSVMQW